MKLDGAARAPGVIDSEPLDRFEALRALDDAARNSSTGERISVDGLSGPTHALVAGHLARTTTVLLITGDEVAARSRLLDLRALYPSIDALLFPGWDPGHKVPQSPSVEVLAQRVETLSALLSREPSAIVATRQALSAPSVDPDRLERAVEVVRVGAERDPLELVAELMERGYEQVDTVQEVGDVARRGGIVDLFSFGRSRPLRIEFWGDEVESIREFDVQSQRSVAKVDVATILPRREILLSEQERELVSAQLRSSGRPRVAERLALDPYFEGYEVTIAAILGMEPKLAHYLPERGAILLEEDQEDDREPPELDRLLPAPSHWRRIDLCELATDEQREGKCIQVATHAPPIGAGRSEGLRESVCELRGRGFRVVVFCENETHRRRCLEILEEVDPPVEVRVGVISEGFVLPQLRLAILADHEVFGRRPTVHSAPRFEEGAHVTDAFSLERGDHVVHIEHGTGLFEAMERLVVDGRRTDCLRLGYAGGDRLFVPVDQLDRVQRLRDSDESETPKGLDKLGGKAWKRRLERTRRAIETMASDLLELYAKRSETTGHRYDADGLWERELAESFPWDETPDQSRAAGEVRDDQISPRLMDRLICGDVGFGKTEIALRAAFKVVLGGGQVAVLVPTTLLAEQHHETFRARFAPYPVELRTLSRFRSSTAQARIIEEIRSGRVDIVIGTHRILSKDVHFANLGLLVIDEEHRFGVRQKEKIKALKLRADCLSMTATPIPRTLHMALSGIRDLSVIATPPKNRFPVETRVVGFSETLIREAIELELARDGQIFFVHNRVRTLPAIEGLLRGIVPRARIGVVHGQMPERPLEKTMSAFYRGEIDLLISTMIVESGLDLPNANTLFVHRADRLGLAQLHQLRGRVGRGGRRAYAYFLVPRHAHLQPRARRRLRAVRDHTELGAGYMIAMRDMEIRGTGNLLGPEQHGFIQTVGFETYCRLLSEVVGELTDGDGAPELEVRIHAEVDAYLSEDYISDPAERFTLYKRIARFTDPSQPTDLLGECRDRFGPPPEPLANLVRLKELELRLREIGVEELVLGAETARFAWSADHGPDRRTLERLAVMLEGRVVFEPSDHLSAVVRLQPDLDTVLAQVREMRGAFS